MGFVFIFSGNIVIIFQHGKYKAFTKTSRPDKRLGPGIFKQWNFISSVNIKIFPGDYRFKIGYSIWEFYCQPSFAPLRRCFLLRPLMMPYQDQSVTKATPLARVIRCFPHGK